MRAKKRVLIVDESAAQGSRLRFMLRTRGFAVRVAATEEDGRLELVSFEPHAVIGVPCATFRIGAFFDLARSRNSGMQTMFLAEKLEACPDHIFADAVLLKDGCSSGQIYEYVSHVCARKRGPRKGAQRAATLAAAGTAVA